ncbi:MAG: hypothetical protein IKF78_00525 [Atopobiaceae bacterium]|nr:hypothetical protein [Atopobiaceae bacterium]
MSSHVALDTASKDEIKNQLIRTEQYNLYLAWKLFWNTEPETEERDDAIEIKHAIEQTLIVLGEQEHVKSVGTTQLTEWMQDILANIDDYEVTI